MDAHRSVEDFVVADGRAEVPADVEGQVAVTWRRVTLNCEREIEANSVTDRPEEAGNGRRNVIYLKLTQAEGHVTGRK